MRHAVLLRSVRRLLDREEDLITAAYGWQRHRLMIPYAGAAFVVLAAVAAFAGFEQWPARIALGAAGAAVAVSATTDYRVVALTSRGVVICRSSRIRQYARKIVGRLAADDAVEPVGGTVLATDWRVGHETLTVPRSSERAIEQIAAARRER